MQFIVSISDRAEFVYLHKTGKGWSTRVWANTATKIDDYAMAQAVAAKFVGARIWGTEDEGKHIWLVNQVF